MATLKDLIVDSNITKEVASIVTAGAVVPSMKDLYVNAISNIDTMFDVSNIPNIDFRSPSSANYLSENIDKIKGLIDSTSISLQQVTDEHKALSQRYLNLRSRIFNDFEDAKQALASSLGYQCVEVSVKPADLAEESICGSIGKYVTLPYFMDSATMYNDSMFIRGTSTGTITFDNLSAITSLPLTEPVSIKITSENRSIDTTLNVSLNTTTANAVYLRFLNNLESVTVTLTRLGVQVATFTSKDSEMLINFEPKEFDMITIDTTVVNPNVSKPVSIQMDKLQIFTNLVFARNGVFQSKPIELGDAVKLYNVNLKHKNQADASLTNSSQFISISTDPEKQAFNKVDVGYKVDLSAYKYKYAQVINYLNTNFASIETNVGQLYKYPVPDQTMNIKGAQVYLGLNRSFADAISGTSQLNDAYENWSKVGPFWKTSVVNFEENLEINIGDRVCLVNNKERTGSFMMPIGVSVIEVHEKDVDFSIDITDIQAVENDPLYPFNMAYIFAGLADFDGSQTSTNNYTEKSFYAEEPITLFMNEAFIPLTMSLIDENGSEYDLQISSEPSIPGTFTIMPNKGIVKIYPKSAGVVNLRYKRANDVAKPCGILFNRLLTFIPLRVLYNMTMDEGSVFFSFTEDTSGKFILIPQPTDKVISHAHIAYNLDTDKIYTAARIELTSTNKYLTPLVNKIFVEGR